MLAVCRCRLLFKEVRSPSGVLPWTRWKGFFLSPASNSFFPVAKGGVERVEHGAECMHMSPNGGLLLWAGHHGSPSTPLRLANRSPCANAWFECMVVVGFFVTAPPRTARLLWDAALPRNISVSLLAEGCQ